MYETKLGITVEELAAFVQDKLFRGEAGEPGAIAYRQALRMLAADALYEALGRLQRKFHAETDCGQEKDGLHWAECESAEEALALSEGTQKGGPPCSTAKIVNC